MEMWIFRGILLLAAGFGVWKLIHEYNQAIEERVEAQRTIDDLNASVAGKDKQILEAAAERKALDDLLSKYKRDEETFRRVTNELSTTLRDLRATNDEARRWLDDAAPQPVHDIVRQRACEISPGSAECASPTASETVH